MDIVTFKNMDDSGRGSEKEKGREKILTEKKSVRKEYIDSMTPYKI